MLKKLIIFFLIVTPLGVYAQDKVAYISTEEIFSQMPDLREVENKLSAKQEEIKKVMAGMQSEYETKAKAFQESKEELTESLLMDRQKQLKDIEDRFQTYAETSDKEFTELRQQLITPIQQKLQKAIQDVGSEQGYTYIIERGALPYISSSAVDAGKLVKAKLGMN